MRLTYSSKEYKFSGYKASYHHLQVSKVDCLAALEIVVPFLSSDSSVQSLQNAFNIQVPVSEPYVHDDEEDVDPLKKRLRKLRS